MEIKYTENNKPGEIVQFYMMNVQVRHRQYHEVRSLLMHSVVTTSLQQHIDNCWLATRHLTFNIYYYYYYYYIIYIVQISKIESEALASLGGEHD